MTQITLREYLRTTEDAITSGRIEEAMANCQNILMYFPEALEAQRLLGEVYLAQNQLDEARQTFEWILTNDPENVIVYCDRALISERTSDFDTALDCYQQAYELSRGSSDIRQQFNQLSARVGQQEFMFSRAGLARLYMRGDLLTQAIQEWEAVLAVSPDRLDARLGLMETYWREGSYEKAEQVAMQLLEEVPTCLKALLFLAHIASISNMPRARDLLLRAEALDPELTMAQELFADLEASQPGDPFLTLLKKEPIQFENGRPVTAQAASASAQSSPAVSAPLEHTYGNWDNLDNWEQSNQRSAPAYDLASEATLSLSAQGNGTNLPTFSPQQPEMPAAWVSQLEEQVPATPSEPAWYQQAPAESWSSDISEEGAGSPPAWLDSLTRGEQEQPSVPKQVSAPLPPVSSRPLSAPLPPVPSQPLYAEPAPAPAAEGYTQPQVQADEEAVPFFFPSDEENDGDMGWPEWLKSLGAEALEPEQTTPPSAPLPEFSPVASQQERKTPAWEAPELSQSAPAAEEDPWAALPSLSAQNEIPASTPEQPAWMQEIAPTEQPAAENGTPAWMQQFSPSGSTTQGAVPDWMQTITPIDIPTEQPATPDWMQQFSSPESATTESSMPDWMQSFATDTTSPAPGAAPDWMQPFSQTPQEEKNSTPSWMQGLANAESQIYQEPALSSGAPVNEQEQRYITSLADLERDLQAQGFVPMEPGSLASIAQAQSNLPAQPPQEVQPSLSSALAQLGNFGQPPVPQNNETWWNAQNHEQPSAPPTIPQTPGEALNPFAALGARTNEEAPRPFAPLPSTPTPLAPAPQPLTPAYRSDALLDNDLETTMKRPAITLQPMKAGDTKQERSSSNSKGRGERKPVEYVNENNLSNHERLIRGYQYQLNGAYDEAMQEYRLIIRNAPELLEDVISNLRALLKINPRFSLGYRVLGDAYMRKGEYLQAMESYNKALTMAKKAKN